MRLNHGVLVATSAQPFLSMVRALSCIQSVRKEAHAMAGYAWKINDVIYSSKTCVFFNMCHVYCLTCLTCNNKSDSIFEDIDNNLPGIICC
ncbi:hypothetical protein R5R35_005196 [Gryllus longicercus]|uniref:Uncharacterized protein n=1 Tax=Gryllus longicercus TaxID=2509291 RepID=A0AAN9W170_9ORTH